MNEVVAFLRAYYFILIYGLTLIISMFYYRKYFDTVLKYFPMVIAYTFFNELLGVLIRDFEQFQLVSEKQYAARNALIYNIYNLIFFPYFFYVYYYKIISKQKKRIIKVGIVLFAITSLVNTFLNDFNNHPQLYSYLAGVLVLILSIILYLLDLKKHDISIPKKYNLLVWVSYGLLFFNIYYFPVKLIRNINFDFYSTYLNRSHLFMIVLMYVLFCIGFIKSKRRAFR